MHKSTHQPIFFVIILMLAACTSLQATTAVTSSEPTLAPTYTPQSTAIASLTPSPTEPPPPPTETPLPPSETPIPPTPTPEKLKLSSPAFDSGEMIPRKYAYDYKNLSPPLEWSDPPEGTLSFALILYSDPVMDTGGNWVHWVLYNIPPETRALPEGLTPDEDGLLQNGSQHFKNSWQMRRYDGPNPPHIYTFKYYFQIFALDTLLNLDEVEKAMIEDGTLPWIGPSKDILMRAVESHILAQGTFMAKYKNED